MKEAELPRVRRGVELSFCFDSFICYLLSVVPTVEKYLIRSLSLAYCSFSFHF